jgi:hypothetical protein
MKVLTVKAKPKQTTKHNHVPALEILSESTPKEVMIRHMNWFHEQAGKIADKIEKLLQTADPSKAELVLSDLREMLKFREAAVKCAHMVAPYVHPRLTAIAFAAGDERGKFVLRAPTSVSIFRGLGRAPGVTRSVKLPTCVAGMIRGLSSTTRTAALRQKATC